MPRKKMMLINHWASLRYDQPISLILPYLLDLLVKKMLTHPSIQMLVQSLCPGLLEDIF